MTSRPFLLVLLLLALPAAAQTAGGEAPRRDDLDARLFYAVYDVEHPVFEGAMRYTNDASYPIFLAVVPVLGAAALLTAESEGPAVRLFLSQAGALGLVAVGKFGVNRARPFAALPDVEPRQRHPPTGLDPYSFPSGHSGMAFAIATSASLSYPEWYVIVPTMTWATATALSRVWHGMHYPLDVAVGAALGAGTAALVHVIFAGDAGDEEEIFPGMASAPAVTFRFGL